MLCVKAVENNLLQVSNSVPCDGYYLLAETDIQNTLSAESVFALVGAAASLYALVYVIKFILKQLGF
ncbi:hypothetical protein PLEI_1327 [Photobacterium leiognathi lrivu.4.1]|uniref:Uncharacterized protein n=1 Tax=Photobacterium leiognathi lrivu.4.1 TaxID=1248232 RepID=V5F260_PHOLE|nr:hypothetical protein [Photobacterium leiognathi]GAD29674.1 hypothetical protein PLEI_1327 [Photobacterium leiognathi lrivu.4.1]